MKKIILAKIKAAGFEVVKIEYTNYFDWRNYEVEIIKDGRKFWNDIQYSTYEVNPVTGQTSKDDALMFFDQWLAECKSKMSHG